MKLITSSTPILKVLQNLQVGEIFGFSAHFKQQQIIDWADEQGIKTSAPNKKTPERIQYGDYVLKVRSIGFPKIKRLNTSAVSYVVERALAERKCPGYRKDSHAIVKGQICVVESTPKTLGSGATVYEKHSYCLECSKARIAAELKKLNAFNDTLNSIKE
jgi:hypothetical protein